MCACGLEALEQQACDGVYCDICCLDAGGCCEGGVSDQDS